MSVKLRACLETDIPSITAIYAHAVTYGTASFELVAPDQPEMSRRRAALVQADYPYVVAEREDAIVGYAYAGPYRPRPAYRSTVEDSIYVAPSAQGAGIGRLLLERLIGEAEARDFRLMVAVIGDAESLGSIGLHRSLGFDMVGTLPGIGYKHGRWLSTLLMHRALGAGVGTPPTRP